MNDQQLKQLAEKLSTGNRIVTIESIHEAFFTFDVWYGLVHFELNGVIGNELNEYFLHHLQSHVAREISEAEERLARNDPTGYALHQYMLGKEGMNVYMMRWPDDPSDPFPTVKTVAGLGLPVKTIRLRKYEAMFPTGMMETCALWLEDTLFMLEWKPVVPYGWRGFAEFIQTLSDMELVTLQKQARQTDDAESLNLILVELGKRERSHSAA